MIMDHVWVIDYTPVKESVRKVFDILVESIK